MNTIKRRDLYVKGLNAGMYKSLAWSFYCYTMCETVPTEELTPFLKDGQWIAIIDGEETLIEDAPKDHPVFTKRDPFKYKAGEFIGATVDGESTFSRALWHHLMIVYAFGAKIPFAPEGRTIKALEKIVSANLVDSLPNGEPAPEGKFSVTEHLACTEAGSSILEGLAPIFAPATTEKSLVADPKVRIARERLLKENKDRLHDPAVISSIKSELIAIDKESLKGDDAMDALAISGKAFNQVRIKTLGMHGEESAFTDGTSVTLIPTSLDEGLNLEYTPEYANAVRQASFNRGSETALGGELTQFLIRVFQNHTVDTSAEDCGTKRGIRRVIPVARASWFEGLNVFEAGKTIQLTSENIGQYAGKEVMLRSPQRCRSPNNTFCSKCLGAPNAADPAALAGSIVDIGNTILYVYMKKAHGGALNTNTFSFETDLH